MLFQLVYLVCQAYYLLLELLDVLELLGVVVFEDDVFGELGAQRFYAEDEDETDGR